MRLREIPQVGVLSGEPLRAADISQALLQKKQKVESLRRRVSKIGRLVPAILMTDGRKEPNRGPQPLEERAKVSSAAAREANPSASAGTCDGVTRPERR